MSELAADTLRSIRTLCAEGYNDYDDGNYKQALRSFYKAWLKVPKPQHDHNAAGWVLTAIGDTYYRLGQFPQAIEALKSAKHCPDMSAHPFIALRLGQSLLDEGQEAAGVKELLYAFAEGGSQLFLNEPLEYQKAIAPFLD